MSTNAVRAWNVAIRAATPEKLEIAVYDAIGKNWLFGDGFGASDFLSKLRSQPNATSIDLRVNSNGGIIDDASAMMNLLAERAAAGVQINGFVDGMAASAASLLLTAAHRVEMPENAFMMLHEARTGARGRASDLELAAGYLRKANDMLAQSYSDAAKRRGKNKTKEDFLQKMASGDFYLNAAEAIEWGLADAVGQSVKIAASLADVSDLPENAPEALRAAPYVVGGALANTEATETPPVAAAELLLERETPPEEVTPAPEGRAEQTPNLGEEQGNMTFSKALVQALGIGEDADDAAAVMAINRIKASAKAGAEIEVLVGATGQGAVGAVRALQETQAAHAVLNVEVSKLKVINARRDFDAAIAKGMDPKDRKLTPATAKLYQDRFDKALAVQDVTDCAAVASAAEKAAAIVEDLNGYLAVAPRVTAGLTIPGGTGGSHDVQVAGPMMFGGKAFETMNGPERKRLKDENPDLYKTMREDAIARRAI